ncbi:MAG: hypothetical protein U0X76_12350 [Bacteroidia bacterium]
MAGKGIKIVSWNINGIRAVWKKGIMEWILGDNADIICFQKQRRKDQLTDDIINIDGYESYFFCREKRIFRCCDLYTNQTAKVKAGLGNPDFDVEGRVIEMEFDDFVLFNVYFPNGGRGPEELNISWTFMMNFLNVHRKSERKRKM